MNDKELVLELCKRLNLKSVIVRNLYYLGEDEYYENLKKNSITIGSGAGYNGFHTIFCFDENGKLTHHGVWE